MAGAGLDGAVIVTTPQEISLQDVRKEINFCEKVGLRVLGVVENMAQFVCPKCHMASTILPTSTGGAEKLRWIVTRPGVDKVKPKGWFKYSLQIDCGVVWDCSTMSLSVSIIF